MAIEIVDLPIKIVIFHSYVSSLDHQATLAKQLAREEKCKASSTNNETLVSVIFSFVSNSLSKHQKAVTITIRQRIRQFSRDHHPSMSG
jgi:hypothetical protein